jgi:5-methylcytosine-specific restriction endonuclease McrA
MLGVHMEADTPALRLIQKGAAPRGTPDRDADRAPMLAVADGIRADPTHSEHAVGTLPARLDAVRLLSLDAHGRVMDWISWQDATCLYARGAVAWTLGEPCLSVHGGISRATGERSMIELHPIVAARGHARSHVHAPTPALNNPALFARDQHLCLYCGKHFSRQLLTRDHVMPLSRGGRDIWENVVSACFHCNSRKGGRTPQQASMPLLAVPYRPSWIEHLILSNRNILADQMAFLKTHLPKNPRRPMLV